MKSFASGGTMNLSATLGQDRDRVVQLALTQAARCAALTLFLTFSNPSAFSDHRRRMPWKPVCLFHNAPAPGRRVLRLCRPVALENLPRSTLARSSRREECFRPVREWLADPACRPLDVECEEG